MHDFSFFTNSAFVSIDLQDDVHERLSKLPPLWKDMGFDVKDCQAAIDYLFDVARPNARRTALACRSIGIPVVLVHWGYEFKDAMDLDPDMRMEFLKAFGPDYTRWPHHISHPSSKPATILNPQPTDYAVRKTGQDAFMSSHIDFVLRNLGAKNLLFAGGHTGACLFKTARSARQRGYRTACLEDATYDARESTRERRIKETGYDVVLTTEQFINLAAQYQKQ